MPEQPNLLFLMPDQLRHDFLSCYGADFIDTPHIDSLAQQGTRFERAYSTHPICVPTRAALLTGRNAIRNGVTDNGLWLRPDLHESGIYTWPELLNEAGYHTAAIGKMHFYPWDITHGFQYRVAAEDKRWIHVRDDYYEHLREHGERKYHGNEHAGYHEHKGAIINKLPLELTTDRFVGDETCRFLRVHGGDGPFAMMVGFPGPHGPYDPPPEYNLFSPGDMPDPAPEVPGDTPQIRRNNINGNRAAWNGVDYTEFTEAQKKKIRAHYAGLVKQIDDEVGKILETLRDEGLLDNTIIIFASDHGDYLGDHSLIGKGSFYESSTHVPLIVRQPDGAGGAASNELVALSDVTATLLTLAGVDVPGYMVDSQPLPDIGLNMGGLGSEPRDHLIGMTSSGWMNFDGTWKLSKYSTGEITLFNLIDDPHEQRNRYGDADCWDVYQRLDTQLTQTIMASIVDAFAAQRVYGDVSLSSDPAFGHRGWQRTYPQPIVVDSSLRLV